MKAEEQAELLATIAKRNPKDYNLTKLSEELFELGEQALKAVNKPYRFNQRELEAEAADVFIRLTMLFHSGQIDETVVYSNMERKLKKMKGYLIEEQYERI